MSFKITQETFNDAVVENMECFGLSIEESIEDTVNQFKAQGADLFGIIMDPLSILSVNPVKKLKEKIMSDISCQNKVDLFKELSEIIKSAVPYQVYCGKCGIYEMCFEYLLVPNQEQLILASLSCLLALLDGYPDLVEPRGIAYFMRLLDKPPEHQKFGLQFIQKTCVKHETNRSRYMDGDISRKLGQIMAQSRDDEILIYASKAIFSLTLDDDIRTEAAKFYTNAINLADHVLKPICYLLKVKKEPDTLYHLLQALNCVVVNYKYCSEVDSEGGLAAVINILEKNYHIQVKTSREELISQCYKFLTSLAANDIVKDKLMKYEIAQMVHASMNEYTMSLDHIHCALLLVSKISLRSPEYGKLFFKLDFPDLIIQAMNNFRNESKIQVAGCWCIRNMSSRNPEYHTQFLRIGTEEILIGISNLNKLCSYDAKIALQELGCEVVAREPWTGLHGDKLARD